MKRFVSAIMAQLLLFAVAVPVPAEEAGMTELVLADSSHLVLDTETGYVDMIDGTVTVSELKANFASAVTVKGSDGNEKADTAPVATDDVVSAGDASLKALIYGDVNRDGKVNLTDVGAVLKSVAKWDVDINTLAADVDKTEKINLLDASKLLKYIAKWDDISLGNVRWVFENKKLTAESESPDLDLYFESPMVKIPRSDTLSSGKYAYKLKTARNETESCQFFVTSTKDMERLTVELSDFEHEYGEGTLTGEVFIHYYYIMSVTTNCLIENGPSVTKNDYFPEVLLPLASSFEVKENTSQGFTVNVTADKDTPAGMYKATLTVKDSEGKELKCADVYTYVWDFTLPDAPYSKSAFGMSGYAIYSTLGSIDSKWFSGDDGKTHALYYDFLLDHNISSYQLPYPITDTRADAYMSDPRVTSFEICGENLRLPDYDDFDTVLQNFAKVQSNPVWAEKGHFYYVDEPVGESGAALVKHQHEYLTEKLGTDDFDIILPFANSMANLNNCIDMLDFIGPYVDIYVPGTTAFMPNYEGNHYGETGQFYWTPRQAYSKYGESLPRLSAIKEDPAKELWWYTCVGPTMPWPNLFVHHQGIMMRVIWWQQFMYDVEGFLYWGTQYDWDRLAKRPMEYPGNGDGTLIYLGERYGRTGPLASWRLTQIRDGYDDFDYLRIAEELVGRETVMKIVNKLTTNVTTVKEDPALMEALRDEVAKIIVENQAK